MNIKDVKQYFSTRDFTWYKSEREGYAAGTNAWLVENDRTFEIYTVYEVKGDAAIMRRGDDYWEDVEIAPGDNGDFKINVIEEQD